VTYASPIPLDCAVQGKSAADRCTAYISLGMALRKPAYQPREPLKHALGATPSVALALLLIGTGLGQRPRSAVAVKNLFSEPSLLPLLSTQKPCLSLRSRPLDRLWFGYGRSTSDAVLIIYFR